MSWTDLVIVGTGSQVVGVGDFYGNGSDEVLLQSPDGVDSILSLLGDLVNQETVLGACPSGFLVAGAGDYDGDGTSDILWRAPDGTVGISSIRFDVQVAWSAFGVVPPVFGSRG